MRVRRRGRRGGAGAGPLNRRTGAAPCPPLAPRKRPLSRSTRGRQPLARYGTACPARSRQGRHAACHLAWKRPPPLPSPPGSAAQSCDPAPRATHPPPKGGHAPRAAARRAFVGAVPAVSVWNPDIPLLVGMESPFLCTAQAARGRAAAPGHAAELPPRSRTKINICRRPRAVRMQAATGTPPSDVTTSPPPRGGAARPAARSCGRHRCPDSGRRHIPPAMHIRPPQGLLPAANTRTPAGRAAPRSILRRRIGATPRCAITAPCLGQGTERGMIGT